MYLYSINKSEGSGFLNKIENIDITFCIPLSRLTFVDGPATAA